MRFSTRDSDCAARLAFMQISVQKKIITPIKSVAKHLKIVIYFQFPRNEIVTEIDNQ